MTGGGLTLTVSEFVGAHLLAEELRRAGALAVEVNRDGPWEVVVEWESRDHAVATTIRCGVDVGRRFPSLSIALHVDGRDYDLTPGTARLLA